MSAVGSGVAASEGSGVVGAGGSDAAGAGGSAGPGSGGAVEPGRRPRRRLVLWVSMGVAVVVAVLVAVLASAGPASQVQAFSPLLGKPAPPISGKAIDMGGVHSLADYRGKWVLVNFSASWCVPCVQETPQLLTFAHDHAASGDAVILGVVDDEGDKSNLASFLRSRHATWPVVDDPSSTVAYGVGKLPESYVVDPRGTVVVNIPGEVNADQLNQVLVKYSATGS